MAIKEFEINYNFEYVNVQGEKIETGNRFYRQFAVDEHELLAKCNEQFKKDEPTASNIRINVKTLRTID